jgi:hypothetical protein
MNYDQFRAVWHEALDAADLLHFSFPPSEAVDLRWMSRTYEISVSLRNVQRAGPFHVTAGLSWKWDAALSARMATTEEDLLVELLGQDGYLLVTEQPWLRVDVTLRATLPHDSPISMPATDAWRRWAANVANRLAPLFPIGETGEYDFDPALLSWRSEPVARVRCDPAGQLYLTGVELSAWQGVGLPRQWDHPDRAPDEGPAVHLADFVNRLRQALQTWEDSLRRLSG